MTEAFGGHGGIALYNRDLLTALCKLPDCREVTALPRLVSGPIETIPERLDFRSRSAGGVGAYLQQWAQLLIGGDKCDLVVCGHINLLPLAEVVRRRHNAKQAILTALKQPKQVPSGLDYFDFSNFCQRLEQLVGNVMSREPARP